MSFLKSPTEIPLTKIYNLNKFGQNTSQKLPSICEALCMWILTPEGQEATGDRSISNPKTRKQKGLGVHSQRPRTPSCPDAQGTEGHERHGSSHRDLGWVPACESLSMAASRVQRIPLLCQTPSKEQRHDPTYCTCVF